jgi:hypothetical protein
MKNLRAAWIVAIFMVATIFFSVHGQASLSKIQGYAERGGKVITVSPTTSYKVQESYPGATVTVYISGTLSLASIYSDASGTIKSNPFTADSTGYYSFYAVAGNYDVKFSGIGISLPFTLSNVLVGGSSNGAVEDEITVKSKGAICNGVADDTAAINLAITAHNLAGGGAIVFPVGRCKITSALTTITAPFIVRGYGSGRAHLIGNPATSEIFTTSPTANVFTSTAAKGDFRDIAIENAASTVPTAGAGILVTTANLPSSPNNTYAYNQVNFENIHVRKFYIDIDIQSGANWHLENFDLEDAVSNILRVNNLNNADAGDYYVSKGMLGQAVYQSGACMKMESSGGAHISDLKINGAGAGVGDLSCNNGIEAALTTTASTSILLISNSSIENTRGAGIKATNGYHLVNISNVEFGLYGNIAGELIALDNVNNVVIDNITAQNSVTADLAFRFTNCSNVQLGEYSIRSYSFATSFNGTYSPLGTFGTSRYFEVTVLSPFINGWGNVGGTFETGGYGYWNGRVWLKGSICCGTINTMIFTLPTAIPRPSKIHVYRVYDDNGTCAIQINPDGTVVQSQSVGTNNNVSLEGISYVP